jgi:urease accessory protein UreH
VNDGALTANALHLEAHARDGRTVVGRIRADGLCRASRAFHEGGAARVVVSQLGPGMVRGDVFRAGGRVAERAHLVVTGQMATRILSGPDAVTSDAQWSVEADAMLELLPEPTIVCAGASYRSHTVVQLAPNARAIVSDIIRREPGAALTVTTIARRDERYAVYDTLRFAADDDDDDTAIGTLMVFGMPVCVDALDRAADACTGVRIGTGVLRDGDVLARVTGRDVWDVREALIRLRTAVTAAVATAG